MEKTERFNSKFYEMSSKKTKGGKRKLTLILHEIMEDETHYQDNGISWNEQYVLNSLDSLKGMPLAVEFIDEDKSEIWGHGMTDEIDTEDGRMPIFENSEVVGSCIGGYIKDIEFDNETKRLLLADFWVYQQRYPNFVNWLQTNVPLGNVMGSVEISGLPENLNKIIYEDGYKDLGRVPMDYCYSGHALLSNCVTPADKLAKVLEINENVNKENKEVQNMDEKILSQFVDSVKTTIVEVNNKNSEYETKITELNSVIVEKENNIVELNASVAELQSALDAVTAEKDSIWQKQDVLYKEAELLKEEIAKAKVKERVGELNTSLAEFTEEEKAYAKDEIEAFNAEPMSCEINSIVDKIYAEIGKKEKELKKQNSVSEQNSTKPNVEDIFGEIIEINETKEDTSIF